MVHWRAFFDGTAREEVAGLLPTRRDDLPSAFPPEEVTKVALKLRYLVEHVVPCQLEEDRITAAHSGVITAKVVDAAREAGGAKHASCVVFSLLICRKWFKRQAVLEMWDAEMHDVRATACEVIAKLIIESEEDLKYLLEHVLLKRYSFLVDGEPTLAANAVERAVDFHAVRVIGSSGYQKCISYLWRGWLTQDDDSPAHFVEYDNKSNTSYWAHFDPDRIRVPQYQNAVQVIFSVLFLVLYSLAINSVNQTGQVDAVEAMLYLFTAGFVLDEASKFWKVGRNYIGFWNIFNMILYTLLAVSFVTRMIALGHDVNDDKRWSFNELSYNFLAFTAPMFWMRLLLYLDTFRFFGAMLVVIKVMMKESLIFFALLIVVLIGFFQAFIGLDAADLQVSNAGLISTAMLNAIMQSPEFGKFDDFAPPFGAILYYIFTFVIMVVLLNILIALYGSAYSDITANATDEYMALFAQKCLQFVRAPDENVYIAPLNLVEVVLLPLEWVLSRAAYERVNDVVMGVVYAPLLILSAALEQRQARKVRGNRRRGDDDDSSIEEWEQLGWKVEESDQDWARAVDAAKPNVESDAATIAVGKLAQELTKMRDTLDKLAAQGSGSGGQAESRPQQQRSVSGHMGYGLND